MKPFKKNSQKGIQNPKGQVAVFVALIFQVLFVFFAMMVNVGLLVHHKINLQNSVDLAAYYGAMKQAELLNVMAHVNYQIRQSWKLMVFRYRHLGIMGDDNYPGGFQNNPANDNEDGKKFPAFCMLYSPFDYMETMSNENYCRESGIKSDIAYTIKSPPTPAFVGTDMFGLTAFQAVTIQFNEQVRNTIQQSCQAKNGLSYYALLRFINAYKMDIENRKKLFIKLSKRISKAEDDFVDLDGNSVTEGVKQTLEKNLTYQNKDSITYQYFNSMGASDCGNNSDEWAPAKWLSEIFIYPQYWAFAGKCETGSSEFKAIAINTPAGKTAIDLIPDAAIRNAVTELYDRVQEPDGTIPKNTLFKSSLGFEKNPWCMTYSGVKAEAHPKIPFSPFDGVKIEAVSYAKPFGGTLGPWKNSQWALGSPYSKGGDIVDKVAPPRVIPPDSWTDPDDPTLVPDFIRYVGDEIGTKSNLNMFNYGKSISGYFNKSNPMRLEWWDQLFDPNEYVDIIGSNGDFLAWPSSQDASTEPALRMRDIEISAIAPDQYDLAYYSIESDYYRNYLVRLQKQEGKGDLNFPIRGDLGSRKNDDAWKKFSIKDQIKLLQDKKLFDVDGAMTFYAKNYAELLTSFKAKSPDDQVMDETNNFGKCTQPVGDSDPPEKATTGNCVSGGRVGYSVKLVDGTFLKQEQSLGGKGTNGVIKNPPSW